MLNKETINRLVGVCTQEQVKIAEAKAAGQIGMKLYHLQDLLFEQLTEEEKETTFQWSRQLQNIAACAILGLPASN